MRSQNFSLILIDFKQDRPINGPIKSSTLHTHNTHKDQFLSITCIFLGEYKFSLSLYFALEPYQLLPEL
jgi:hypothetical protein